MFKGSTQYCKFLLYLKGLSAWPQSRSYQDDQFLDLINKYCLRDFMDFLKTTIILTKHYHKK